MPSDDVSDDEESSEEDSEESNWEDEDGSGNFLEKKKKCERNFPQQVVFCSHLLFYRFFFSCCTCKLSL